MKKLNMPTPTCKLCFENIRVNTLSSLFLTKPILCSSCKKRLIPKFKTLKFDSYKIDYIYDYDEKIRSLIYQFKATYDIELKDVFLNDYKIFLRLKYFNYIIVPAPSFKDKDDERGFNHVVEIFKPLKLKIAEILIKTQDIKQANLNKEERENIKDVINIKSIEPIRNKNILLVDDIFTTGSTIRACLDKLRKAKPKNIKILLLSKSISK